jgi:hypothetical protein
MSQSWSGFRHGEIRRAVRAAVPWPDQFPDLMAAALKCEDVLAWAAKADIKAIRADD